MSAFLMGLFTGTFSTITIKVTKINSDLPGIMRVYRYGYFNIWRSLVYLASAPPPKKQIAYEMQSVGLDGTTLRPFEKPLTTTWFMFLAMAMGKSVGIVRGGRVKRRTMVWLQITAGYG